MEKLLMLNQSSLSERPRALMKWLCKQNILVPSTLDVFYGAPRGISRFHFFYLPSMLAYVSICVKSLVFLAVPMLSY